MSGPWEDFKASSTQVEAGPWDDFSPKEEPTEKNMRGERVSQFYKDVGQGALETAGALGSNLALTIPAGLAGLANLPSGIDAAVEAIDKVYGMGYQPKTEVGKRGTENVGKALNLIPEIMGEGGEFWAGNEGKLAGEIYGNFVTDLLPLRAIKAPKWKSKSAAKVEPKLNELEKELDKLANPPVSDTPSAKAGEAAFDSIQNQLGFKEGEVSPLRKRTDPMDQVTDTLIQRGQDERSAMAQETIDRRNELMQDEVKRQTTLEMQAAERQRMENAPVISEAHKQVIAEQNAIRAQLEEAQAKLEEAARQADLSEQQARALEEQQVRIAEAQRILDERQAQIDYETKRQYNLDFNAAERARQERAGLPTEGTRIQPEPPMPRVESPHSTEVLRNLQESEMWARRPNTDERVQQRRAQEAAKAEQEAQLAELEQQLRESAYTPQGDLQGPKTRAWKSKEIGKRGLANSQTGAFTPEVFTFGMRGITRKLSELTDKLGNDPTWKVSIRGALGGHDPLKNPDGTPMVMLHGTTAEINGKLRGSNQGFHAGYGPDSNFFTQKANGEGKRSYLNTREQRSNAQMYPIVIKDGVYPTIKADAGDWSPKEILRPDRDSSKAIRDYISDALRRTGYTDTQIEGFYNYVNNQRGVSATNQAFTDVLKRAGIDGFFYENKAESPKTDKLFRMFGRDDIPARRDFVRNEVNHPKSFVTWSDRNFTSVYAAKGSTNKATPGKITSGSVYSRQRGAIDLKAISETYDALRRGTSTYMDYFKAWRGAFDTRAMQDIESDLRDPKSRSTLVLMRPSSFHYLANKRTDMSDAPRLHENIRGGLESEKGLREIPQLWTTTDENGLAQVTGHEGRHRMDVFKEMGIEAVPVIIRDSGYRWGGTDPYSGPRPTKIRPEEGTKYSWMKNILFPEKTYHDYIKETPATIDRISKPIGQRGLANSQTGAIMLPFGRKPAVDQLKKIEGIKNDPQMRNIFPEKLSVDEVIKEHAARKTPDVDQNFMQKAINHLTKGSLYQAIKTDNPIIRVVGEKIRQANNAAMEATGRLVHDGLAPLARDLSKQEKADVWAVQQMAEAKGVTLTPDFLQKQGFNQKQIDWVMEHKSVMDDMYQRMSDSMRAAGLEPVSPRVAYLASRARGDFRRLIMKDDKVVGIMGDNTRMGLNKQIERLKKDHPEYQIGEERYYGGRAAKGSDEGLMSLMDFLSKDNPDFKVFVDHVNDMLTQDAFQYMNAKSHTMQKKGVFGMEGRKVYADAVKNAQEGMQAQIRYAETMIKWSELSKAIAEVKPLLKADNGLDMPNAKEWANQYIQGALGNSPHKLGEFLDAATASLGKSIGIGTTIPTRAVSAMKSYVNGILLGFVNAGFLTANALQLPRTMPEMAAWLNSKGIEAGYDLGLGRALVTLEKSVTGQKLSALEKGAFEYAKKNHVYSSNLFESGNTVNKGLSYYWQKGTQMITSPLERETRKAAFFAYVHMLDETGFKPSDGLYEAAQNLTDMHMNNYSQAEAPRVYQETGSVGRSAYNLMSFKHNELSRLAMFAREVPNGQVSPTLVAMASQVAFAGLLGTIGFQEADKLFEYITGKMGKPTSMTKLLLDNPEIPDALKFGIGSFANVDLTSRMGLQITPESLVDLAAPGFSKLGDIAGAAGDLITQPNAYNAANLVREAAPLSVGGIMDRTWFETDNGMALNRNKVTASAVRNDADKLWKALGMTGVNESVQKKLSYENQKIDQVYKDKRSKVIDGAIKEYYMRGVLPDSWVKDFVELQGDPKDAIRAINDRIESLNVDRPTKEIMKNAASKSVTSQHKLLRRLGQE